MPAWLGWVAVALLSIYLSVFPALATGAAWLCSRGKPVSLPFLLAAAWIVNELLRASVFTGFAWNPLAAIWAPVWPIRALTAWIGTYGLSGLTVLFAGLIWLAIANRKAQLAVAALAACGVAAAFVPHPAEPDDPRAILLRVVQPDIGQTANGMKRRGRTIIAA